MSAEEAAGWKDSNTIDRAVGERLGFDFNWIPGSRREADLFPAFEEGLIEQSPDGTRKVLNTAGVTVLQKEGAGSIPPHVDHLLKDRTSWEEHYLPRLQYAEERLDFGALRELIEGPNRDYPLGLHCGSLLGKIRDWCGFVGLSYLIADDKDLVARMVDTVGELCYRVTECALASGVVFDYAHFWRTSASRMDRSSDRRTSAPGPSALSSDHPTAARTRHLYRVSRL